MTLWFKKRTNKQELERNSNDRVVKDIRIRD